MNTAKQKSQQVPELLCQLLSPFSSKQAASEIIDKLVQDEEMLDLAIELANRHFLIPTLYQQLCNHGLVHRLDTDLNEYMATMTEFMRRRNNALIEQTKEIVAAVNKQGQVPLLMKGASTLFSDVYPDTGIRFMSDLDILFPEEQVLSAAETLKNIGYEVPVKYQHLEIAKDENGLPYGQHFPPVYRAGAPCAIELHLRPLSPVFQEYMTNKSAFVQSAEIPELKMEGYKAVKMSPIDEIIHCFVHSELAHRNHDYHNFDLRQMDYFVRLIYKYRNKINWHDIHARMPNPADKIVFSHFTYQLNRLFGVNFLYEKGIVTEQALQKHYQKGVVSCFPRYHLAWKVKRFIAEYSKILSKRTLLSLYNVKDQKSLWKAKIHRIGFLAMRYGRPLKFIRRISSSVRAIS